MKYSEFLSKDSDWPDRNERIFSKFLASMQHGDTMELPLSRSGMPGLWNFGRL